MNRSDYSLELQNVDKNMQNIGAVKLTIFFTIITVFNANAQQNNLSYAVAWKQTAAEHRALYYQGFNIARLRVEQALAAEEGKPLAIIADIDDTLLLANDYWGYLISNEEDFFNDTSWDLWVAENSFVTSPGSQEFLQFCANNNVEVFYITNRDQGDPTFELAQQNLISAGFPMVDREHLTVLRETSNKEEIQRGIMEEYEVVVMLGDNLNDFSRDFYLTDVERREELVTQRRDNFGKKFVIFPNPTDGHWIRAIFGESEPPATPQSRRTLRSAATKNAWRP
tara:strand:+ start:976 stop:1821 length:846 start_codon:yes stop_codon:yes gene_type:complete